MRVTIRTFASLRELSTDRCELAVAEGGTVADAWDLLAGRFPGIQPHRSHVRAALNGTYASWDAVIADGDVVAFLPPVSGGGPTGLTTDPIDVAALEASVSGLGHGAVVTFVGRARNVADDGRTVVELDYEAFDEMATAVLGRIVDEAEERFGATVAAVHRVGAVPIGEAAVAIVSAARHRGEAYDASRFVIEAIKDRLPIWKRERFPDGSEWKRPGA